MAKILSRQTLVSVRDIDDIETQLHRHRQWQRRDTVSTETDAGTDAWGGGHHYPPGLAQASLLFRNMDAAI